MQNIKKIKLNGAFGGISFSALMLLYVLISLMGQLILGAAGIKGGFLYIAVSSVFSISALLIIIVFWGVKGEGGLYSTLSVKKFNPLYIFLAILLSAAMLFGFGFINEGISALLERWGANVTALSPPLENAGQYITFFITICVLPAITEEIFFRGVIFNSLGNFNKILRYVLVGLTFALYHCSIVQLIYQFIYGVCLAALTDIAGSVIPSIIAHFINNFVIITLAYFKAEINLFNGYIIAGGLLAFILFAVIYFIVIKKRSTVKEDVAKRAVRDKYFYLYFSVGAAISIALAITALVQHG